MEIDSSQPTNALDQFARDTTPKKASNELGKDEFLKLLVTQLENQNPLEPQDNGEFIAQLAQFSSLEGIDNLNKTMEGFVSSFQSSQALSATALVGREVQVDTDTALMQQGKLFTGVVKLPVSGEDIRLSIRDENGQLVRNLNFGSREAGDFDLRWDGKDNDGESLETGMYTIRAEARIDGQTEQLQTLLGANVDSVTLATQGTGTILNLRGIGAVPLSDVKTVR